MLEKILGKENPADLFNKHLDIAIADKHVRKLQCRYIQGRVKLAPELHTMSRSWDDHLRSRGSEEMPESEAISRDIIMNIAFGHIGKRGSQNGSETRSARCFTRNEEAESSGKPMKMRYCGHGMSRKHIIPRPLLLQTQSWTKCSRTRNCEHGKEWEII